MKLLMLYQRRSFQTVSILVLALAFTACAPASHKLMDQSSTENSPVGPDYIDFSDLPLSDAPDKDSEPAVPTPPTEPNANSNPNPIVAPGPQIGPQTPATPKPKLSGIGIGTVYYLPVYGEKRNCSKDQLSAVRDEQEKVLTQLCKEEIYNCAMQGSCFYLGKEGVRLFAYKKMVKIEVPETKKTIVQPRFRLNKSFTMCPQGMGAHNVCLDPYRSIAADPKFHKIGDVVYIPILKNQKLPDGEIHDGYMIVRDTGGAIKGEGRFDFFIGFDDYHGHLFSKLNLADKKSSHFEYHLVPEEIAQKVRTARRYPLAPVKVHENAFAEMKEASTTKMGLLEIKDMMEFFKLKFAKF